MRSHEGPNVKVSFWTPAALPHRYCARHELWAQQNQLFATPENGLNRLCRGSYNNFSKGITSVGLREEQQQQHTHTKKGRENRFCFCKRM